MGGCDNPPSFFVRPALKSSVELAKKMQPKGGFHFPPCAFTEVESLNSAASWNDLTPVLNAAVTQVSPIIGMTAV